LGTGDSLVFGDNEEFTATYDSGIKKLEINGGVQISDGEFKRPYDTSQYVHNLILLGMHAYSTDAVGVQDNVLGYADEWATVSYTELSDGGNISEVFKPGPWVGWMGPASGLPRGGDDNGTVTGLGAGACNGDVPPQCPRRRDNDRDTHCKRKLGAGRPRDWKYVQ
jgi:hypothetical protein